MASGGDKAVGPIDWKSVVVSTVAGGTAEGESKDGVGASAVLSEPHTLIASGDGKHLLFTEPASNRIRCFSLDGKVSTLLGGVKGFKNADSKSAAFQSPYSLCADPLKPNNLYIGDITSIRYWDAKTDQVTLIAGDAKEGYGDGVGSNARFRQITGLLCHPNGKTLYVADCSNNRIRAVDLTSQNVSTLIGDGKQERRDGTGVNSSLYYPRQIVFDRSPNVKPNSVLLISSCNAIRRFDTETAVLTSLESGYLDPFPMTFTPTGHLIVGCRATDSLHCFTDTGVVQIAGSGQEGFADGAGGVAQFASPSGLAVVANEQCLYVSDSLNHRIRRVTLPPQLFTTAVSAAAPLPAIGGDGRDSKLAAELQALTDRYSAQTTELKALTDRYAAQTAELQMIRSLASDLKRENGLLKQEISSLVSKQCMAEISARPPNEWSAETTVYWVEHIFAPEHKIAEISEFVKELKARAGSNGSGGGVSGSTLLALALAPVTGCREWKLTDKSTVEMLQTAIKALKQSSSAK